VAIALGLALFLIQSRRHPEPETSIYLPGREPAGRGAGDGTGLDDESREVVPSGRSTP
jgi:hypothetical protein